MNATLIKELRERTGVGFGDCKKALVEADWDIDAAIEIVRKQSGAKAEKKADRTAAEGLLGVALADDRKSGAIVEINIETDFAARNDKFVAFVEKASNQVLEKGAEGIADALEDERQSLVQEIGENITIRRAERLVAPNGVVGSYLHQDNKKGTLVRLSGGTDEVGKDVAMHVTAMRPLVVAPSDVPEDVVAKERAILEEQAADSGKPVEIVAKMVEGRLRKFLAESSLTEQPFVKDPDTKVGKLLGNVDARCEGFIRYEVGEGIEREAEDFAAEVKKQLK